MQQQAEVDAIARSLDAYRARGMRMFATSSFQSGSVVLLHLLSRLAPDVPIYFLNTGYHFPETLTFRRHLAKRFGLCVRDLFSPIPRSQQRDAWGRLLFASDPDTCCYLNKLLPLEPVRSSHELWISGIRATQSPHRSCLSQETRTAGKLLRYHPLLYWSQEQLNGYRRSHNLPLHPLDPTGLASIGCAPCTCLQASLLGGREARWHGLRKTECGLHTQLAETDA